MYLLPFPVSTFFILIPPHVTAHIVLIRDDDTSSMVTYVDTRRPVVFALSGTARGERERERDALAQPYSPRTCD